MDDQKEYLTEGATIMAETTMKPLHLHLTKVGQTAVVKVSGSAGMNEAEKMRRTLEKLAVERTPVIVLELSEMDFICSLGLGAIIHAHLKARHHEGQIRLVNPQPAVRELLETTRLTKLFPIFASVEEAAVAAR
jgi:anti-sigma B factor antagonist